MKALGFVRGLVGRALPAVLLVGSCGAAIAAAKTASASAVTVAAPSSAASCAFAYTRAALAARGWAVGGTVIKTASGRDSHLGAVPVAIFRVHRWYKGGRGASVTVEFPFAATSTSARESAVRASSNGSPGSPYLSSLQCFETARTQREATDANPHQC